MGRNIKLSFTSKNKGGKRTGLPRGGYPGTPQSMCMMDDNTAVVIHNYNNANNTAYLRKYTRRGGYVINSQVAVGKGILGHCNGATYCSKDDKLYCTGYVHSSNTNKVVVLNKNFKYLYSFNLPVGLTGIGYDRTTDEFYCSKGGTVYVFPYSSFKKDLKQSNRKYSHKFSTFSGTGQDVSGYNGIVYRVMWGNSDGYIDMYKHSNGKYLGSIHITYSETESCCFTNTGKLVYLTANQDRGIHWTDWTPASKDTSGSPNSSTTTTAPKAFVATAQKEVGTKEKGSTNNVKYNTWFYGHEVSNAPGGDTYAWCAVFVAWCANKALGNNNTIPKNAGAGGIQDAIHNKGGKWILSGSFPKNEASAKKLKPGDIFTIDPNGNGVADHVGIIKKVSGTTLYTIEGNHGDKVDSTTRGISEIFRVVRPNWPDGTFTVEEDSGIDDSAGEEGGTPVFEAHPEELYSSDNYQYANSQAEETEEQKSLKEKRTSLKEFLQSIAYTDTGNNVVIPDSQLPNIYSTSNYKNPRTKVAGTVTGSDLPCTVNYVEAPYGKITIGGVTIGSYTNGSFPNYLNGIDVKKTNGSMNEYTVSLTHQIFPGDNPNYIDNLISANGYNKIQIEYGDAQAGIAYRDINALLINAKSSFDFFNNCINYTLYATSCSVMSTVNRRNYPAVSAKPSSVINKMLYETGELLQYFPGMENQSFVGSNNLLPTNDVKVDIDSVQNTTPLNYLNKLVGSMKSNTGIDNSSTYYLSINDEKSQGAYFRIDEVNTRMTTGMFPLVYEVDINFPNEKSLVYNFSVDTDYNWPLAYEYAGKFENYSYNINNSGNIITNTAPSNIKTARSTLNSEASDKNWWTNVTEFPIKATLEVKGLTSYLLLLNYIKVNVFYFGNKRNSSGIYIVLGQEDNLSKDGFKTKLDLLRVAGDNQYITLDGRVVS